MMTAGVMLGAVCVLWAACAGGVRGEAELQIDTTFKPEGCDEARLTKAGDALEMHYTGTIDQSSAAGEKGKQFDSSVGRGPFKFNLGEGRVIKGWDQGLLGMCVGEKRTLIIPPALGYGDSGAGADIPGGATLNFEVECLDIKDAPPPPNIFADIDADGDHQLTKEEVSKWFKEKQNMDELPPNLWKSEDKNEDGVVSWEEFSGPKGTKPGEEGEGEGETAEEEPAEARDEL